MAHVLVEVLLALGLLMGLAMSWFVGKRIGSRMRARLGEHPQLGVVQGATLSLMGLLLGFCFAGAVSRFVERQDILVREANAMGTAYLRADLLAEPHRTNLRTALVAYGDTRLTLVSALTESDEGPIHQRLKAQQAEVWRAAVDGVQDRSHFAEVVLPPVNDTIDLLATRNAEDARHIPLLIVVVLIACAMASIATIGLGVETADKRLRIPAAVLAFLIAAALWTTFDLDFPRLGLVRVNDKPLRDAVQAMHAP